MAKAEGRKKRLNAFPDVPGGEIVLYSASDGTVKLDVRLENETIWLSQKQMSLLFGKDSDTIGLHIRNAYKEGELEESATTEESSVVQNEGGRSIHRKVRFYNRDVRLENETVWPISHLLRSCPAEPQPPSSKRLRGG